MAYASHDRFSLRERHSIHGLHQSCSCALVIGRQLVALRDFCALFRIPDFLLVR